MFGPQLGWSGDRPCSEIHGVIRKGSKLVCMACHKSGIERQVQDHVKPNSGKLRDGWQELKPTPTVYSPPKAVTAKGEVLRGGIGR